jgi:hypothetical protein
MRQATRLHAFWSYSRVVCYSKDPRIKILVFLALLSHAKRKNKSISILHRPTQLAGTTGRSVVAMTPQLILLLRHDQTWSMHYSAFRSFRRRHLLAKVIACDYCAGANTLHVV